MLHRPNILRKNKRVPHLPTTVLEQNDWPRKTLDRRQLDTEKPVLLSKHNCSKENHRARCLKIVDSIQKLDKSIGQNNVIELKKKSNGIFPAKTITTSSVQDKAACIKNLTICFQNLIPESSEIKIAETNPVEGPDQLFIKDDLRLLNVQLKHNNGHSDTTLYFDQGALERNGLSRLSKIEKDQIIENVGMYQEAGDYLMEISSITPEIIIVDDEKPFLKKSSKTKQYTCDCGKTFSSARKVSKHKALHVKEYPIKIDCPAIVNQEHPCGASFQCKNDFKAHLQKAHTIADAPFSCNECPRKFFWKIGLIAHTRHHLLSGNPYICRWPNCGRKFPVACRLKEHYRAHSGDRPYLCKYPNCEMAFRNASKLARHTLVHSETARFSCPVCMKKFLRRDGMRNHYQMQHVQVISIIECPIEGCTRSFMNKMAMCKHVKRMHKIAEDTQTTPELHNEDNAEITSTIKMEEDVQCNTLVSDEQATTIERNNSKTLEESLSEDNKIAKKINIIEDIKIVLSGSLSDKHDHVQPEHLVEEIPHEILRNIKIERITEPLPNIEYNVNYPIYNQTVHHQDNFKIELFEANENVDNMENCHAARTNVPWPFKRPRRSKKRRVVKSNTDNTSELQNPGCAAHTAVLPNSFLVSHDMTLYPDDPEVVLTKSKGSIFVSGVNTLANCPLADGDIVMVSRDMYTNIDNSGVITSQSDENCEAVENSSLELIFLEQEKPSNVEGDPTLASGLAADAFTSDSMDAAIANAEFLLTEDVSRLENELEYLTSSGDFFQEELLYADTTHDESPLQVLLLRGD